MQSRYGGMPCMMYGEQCRNLLWNLWLVLNLLLIVMKSARTGLLLKDSLSKRELTLMRLLLQLQEDSLRKRQLFLLRFYFSC